MTKYLAGLFTGCIAGIATLAWSSQAAGLLLFIAILGIASFLVSRYKPKKAQTKRQSRKKALPVMKARKA